MRRFTAAFMAACILAASSILLPPTITRSEDVPLTLGLLEPLASLDPADASDLFSWEVLSTLYSGLMRPARDGAGYTLALAESHTVSTDGLTHTFTIRPEAAFSDGTPITAQTFADSIQRTLTLGGRGAAVVASHLAGVTVDGAGALALTLKRPVPYLDALLSLPPFAPVHPASFPSDRLNPQPQAVISNGVYRVAAFETGTLRLEADPAWQGDPPASPTLILRRYARPADLREALRRGEVDVAWRGLPAQDIAVIGEGIASRALPSATAYYLVFGQREEPFDDLKARQALLRFLNRDLAVRTGYGEAAAPLVNLVPALKADAVWPDYPPLDLEGGALFLKTLGYSRFKRIETELQTASALYGEATLAATDTLRIELNRNEAFRFGRFDTEAKTFLEQIERGTFRLLVIGLTPVVPHPDAYLRPLLAGDVAAGVGYDNPSVTALLDEAALAASLGDEAAARLAWAQAQEFALTDVPLIPLWQTRQLIAFGPTFDPGSAVTDSRLLLALDRLARAGLP